jgi:hypothetical protein
MFSDDDNNLGAELVSLAVETIAEPKARHEFYRKLIGLLESYDSFALDDALGIDDAFDEVYDEEHKKHKKRSKRKSRGHEDDEDEEGEIRVLDDDNDSPYGFRRAPGDEE